MFRIKELLKVFKQGRMSDCLAFSENVPSTALDWCQEALESHSDNPMHGIITDQPTADLYHSEKLIASATQLPEKTWWLGGKNSVELKRTTDAYLDALRPTLRHSNLIMFIDPYLDPTSRNYADVGALLQACGPRKPSPMIQIHRVCYEGSGKDRKFPTVREWKQRFDSVLGQVIRQSEINVEVFLWDDFHDRYLISNLIGILMPNGFDVDTSTTRWAKLDREDRDSVEREFDPSVNLHSLCGRRFTIGV